jgi:hypothetical protein
VVTLHRTRSWKIAIYGGDHGIPHYHIEGPGFRCSVGIVDQRLIICGAPSLVLRDAREWASTHRGKLLAKWRELNG